VAELKPVPVIPAKAGIHFDFHFASKRRMDPAFAGMTAARA
jgi:hypothetical protein